jgi:hypothetical protein
MNHIRERSKLGATLQAVTITGYLGKLAKDKKKLNMGLIKSKGPMSAAKENPLALISE